MRVEFELPPHRRLMGLAQSSKGWFAYIAVDQAAGQFQGAPGLTAQEAIAKAASALDEKIARIGPGGDRLATVVPVLVSSASAEDLGL